MNIFFEYVIWIYNNILFTISWHHHLLSGIKFIFYQYFPFNDIKFDLFESKFEDCFFLFFYKNNYNILFMIN